MTTVPSAGIRYDIVADNEEFLRATEEARRANARAADSMADDYKRMSEKATGDTKKFFASFTNFLPGIPGQVSRIANSFQRLVSQVTDFGEKAEDIAARFGDGFETQVTALKRAFDDLSAASQAAFWNTVSSAQDTPLGRAITSIIEKAAEAARSLTSVAESSLPQEARSNTALEAEIRQLEQVLSLQQFVGAATAETAAEMERIRGIVAGRPFPFGHTTVSEIDQQIEAMKKQTLELRIQAETFGMAAGAAAEYAAELRAIASAESHGGMGNVSADQQRRQREAAEALAEQRQRLTDLEKGKRAGESRERLMTGMDQDIERLRAQGRALTMTAEAAAAYNFEQREMLKFQQARIKPTEEDIAKIRENAKAVGELTAQNEQLKRKMNELQAFGQAFSSSLERAFTSWMDGTFRGWKDFFNNLAKEIATMVLRFQILQPLFGGGGIAGGGLFGSLLSGITGGLGAPARAGGGPVEAGQPYMVGEAGREMFIPRQSGTIVPNSALRGGGGATTINMRIDLAGANGDETIARISAQAARAAAVAAVQQSNAGYAARGRQLQMLGA